MKRSIIPAENNIDLLRLVFALIVVLFHMSVLSGSQSTTYAFHFADGLTAVRGFFVLSGFLIFMSYENSKSFSQYVGKRIRRIYPAYVVAVFFGAFLGALLNIESINGHFISGLMKYLGFNLVFLNFVAPNLPGVFDKNLSSAVNGALWTIKIEVSFYLMVPLLFMLMNRFSKLFCFFLLYFASIAWMAIFNHMELATERPFYGDVGKELPGQLAFFLSGAAIYSYFDLFQRYKNIVCIIGIFIFPVSYYLSIFILLPFSLAICVMALAFGKYVGNAGRYGDISYGVYVFHFPIIQSLVGLGLFAQEPMLAMLLTLCFCVLISYTSWHLVEKPFLQKGSHYRIAESVVDK